MTALQVIKFNFQVFPSKESNVISLQITFGVIVTGRKTDTGTEGDVVFLLSPWVMSSPFRLCLHKVVAVLSIHCRHGYSTASATLLSTEPPGATQATIGQCVRLTSTLSNERRNEWCHWKDGTEAEMCTKRSVSEIFCWRTNLTRETVTLAVISLKGTGEGGRQGL